MSDRSAPNDKPGRWVPNHRRTIAAFITGAAILGACLPLLLAKSAGARGPTTNSVYSLLVGDGASSASGAATEPSSQKRRATNENAGLTSGRSVCVRLCDGAFFPIAPVANHSDIASYEESCSALCPDAPTALYLEPRGSDKIEDAVSPSGAPYTALPVALRYRTIADNTCACHRTLAKKYPLLRDATLRKGDTVMTANGFMVFQGSRHLPYAPEDFVALAVASIPKDQRAALMAMERASAPSARGLSSGSSITLQTSLRATPLRSQGVGASRALGSTAISAIVDKPPS